MVSYHALRNGDSRTSCQTCNSSSSLNLISLRCAEVGAVRPRLGRSRGLSAAFAPRQKSRAFWHSPRRGSRPAALRCAAFFPVSAGICFCLAAAQGKTKTAYLAEQGIKNVIEGCKQNQV